MNFHWDHAFIFNLVCSHNSFVLAGRATSTGCALANGDCVTAKLTDGHEMLLELLPLGGAADTGTANLRLLSMSLCVVCCST